MGKLVLFKFLDLLLGLLSLIPAMMAVIGSLVARLHPTRYPDIHWFGLLLPIILILNLLILLFWIWKKSPWMIVPLTALLINLPYIISVIHLPIRKPEPPERKVTVATYNIRNEIGENIFLDAIQFADFVSKEEIDILNMQEFPQSGVAKEGLILELKKIMPYYHILSQTPEGLNVALFSKYPILEVEPIPFGEKTDNSALWADINLDGDRVRIFNNHLQTTNLNQNKIDFSFNIGKTLQQIKTLKRVVEENGSIRTQQADMIRKLIDKCPYPLIVCGDFNTSTASYTYRTIKGKLRDSFRDAGRGYGYSYRYLKKFYRIDFIFFTPEVFRATRYYSPELEFSDHKPVVVTLDFTPANLAKGREKPNDDPSPSFD